MPAKNWLTSEQKEKLQQAIRESDCPHFRERALMLLLMNDGKTYQEISDFLGCSHRSVAYWFAECFQDNRHLSYVDYSETREKIKDNFPP